MTKQPALARLSASVGKGYRAFVDDQDAGAPDPRRWRRWGVSMIWMLATVGVTFAFQMHLYKSPALLTTARLLPLIAIIGWATTYGRLTQYLFFGCLILVVIAEAPFEFAFPYMPHDGTRASLARWLIEPAIPFVVGAAAVLLRERAARRRRMNS